MTLLERPTEAPVRMECRHDARGVCWACSDQDPRWREWRISAGQPADPPNFRKTHIIAPRRSPNTVSASQWRQWYERLYGKRKG